MQLLLLMNKEL